MSWFRHLSPEDIIPVIEEYRLAYMLHAAAPFCKDRRYKPLISYDKCERFATVHKVSLYDTWLAADRPGTVCLGKFYVEGSSFVASELYTALEDLLNFTRIQFTHDVMFNRIGMRIKI